MGRKPCCSKVGLNRGAWTAGEDKILTDYVELHGHGNWRNLPLRAGLKRCGKSCRLRWVNYLRSDIKRGNITNDEEELIVRLHRLLGNRWSLIAGRLPGRTDNEIKNYWNTKLRRHNSTSSSKHWNQFEEEPMKKTCDSVPQHKDGSYVVKTKAMRCTKTYFGPHPHKMKPIDSIPKPEQSDLLNSDFSSLVDTNHCNNDIINLFHFFDGPLSFYYDEMLENQNVSDDYDQSNIAAQNDHYLASIPECGKDVPLLKSSLV